jgi:hypothetical protein
MIVGRCDPERSLSVHCSALLSAFSDELLHSLALQHLAYVEIAFRVTPDAMGQIELHNMVPIAVDYVDFILRTYYIEEVWIR